jgi:hypothetical protein
MHHFARFVCDHYPEGAAVQVTTPDDMSVAERFLSEVLSAQ